MSKICKSKTCHDRLCSVLGEFHKANQVVRTLIQGIEEDRVSSTRHNLHLDALRTYQLEIGQNALSDSDIEKFYEKGRVIENPDVEMPIDQSLTGFSNDQSLSSQSLSINGFSDSDSDYIP